MRRMLSGGLGGLVCLWLCTGGVVFAADLANGKAVHADKCEKCHGKTGKGDGPTAGMLKKKPRDWTDKTEMTKFTDAELKKEILEGKAPMPAFKGKISDKDVEDVLAYLRTFAK